MKNQFKYTKFYHVVAVGMIFVLISGCVSKRKYNEALNELARLSVAKDFDQYKASDQTFRKDELIHHQQEALQSAEDQLDSLHYTLDRHKAHIQNQRTQIDHYETANWEATIMENELVIRLKNDIVFDPSESILNQEGQDIIESVAHAVTSAGEPMAVWVIGHADDDQYQNELKDNWDISSERALAVVRELIEHNVDPSTITASAKSMYDPLPNGNPAQNRRTEIIIVPEDSAYITLQKLIEQDS